MSYVSPTCNLFVRNFSAGFLDTPEADVVSPGASPDARNTLFAKISEDPLRVTIGKRGGHRLVTPTALTLGSSVDGLFEYRRAAAANVLLAMCNGTLSQFDQVDAFTAIVAGFTSGQPARFVNVKNQVVVMDGTLMKRVQALAGVLTAYDVGFAAPTGAPALATAAGPGVTGTYEGFAVWYDASTDHESSPSPTSAAVVFANQTRSWTKPAGAPPANVTSWRVYVRRTDTNEANFYRAGTFAVGAGAATETTSDLARVNLGPSPSANNPPPAAFAFMDVFRGYAIGVLPNDTNLYFSGQADFESWAPSDVLNVNYGRQEVRSVRVVGENCVVQTPTMSFRLEGDRMPFRIVNLHGAFGNVSQDAATEVDAWLYAWDELKGPYRVSRDFGTWQPLVTNRIEHLLRTVNKDVLETVKVVHDPLRHLVLWSFPVGTSTRKRTLIGYDYTVNTWTSPLTGMEVGALSPFTTTTGLLGVYMGDLWGRVYELFASTREGIPAGTSTLSAPITGATSGTVTAAAATFYTSGDGMAGMPVAVLSPAGSWQWRRIQSNTATTITLDTTNDNPWTTVPAADGTWTVIVGGIEWYWTVPWLDFGRPDRLKRGSYFTLMGATASSSVAVEVLGRFNNEPGTSGSLSYAFPTSGAAGVWGTGIWGESLWATVPQQARKQRIGRTFLSAQFRLQNFYPDQAVDVTGYGVEGDWLPRRRASG